MAIERDARVVEKNSARHFADDCAGLPRRHDRPRTLVARLISVRLISHFNNNYSVVYGSLGAVVILMLWSYLTGVTILIGGEVNALIEQAAARSGDPEAKRQVRSFPVKAPGYTWRERNHR